MQQGAAISMQVARLPETLIQEMAKANPSVQIMEDVHVIEFATAGGLGFSIAGGAELPIDEEDHCIYVTGIQVCTACIIA